MIIKMYLVAVTAFFATSLVLAHGDDENEQTAWGIGGDAKHVSRTITVDMSDLAKYL